VRSGPSVSFLVLMVVEVIRVPAVVSGVKVCLRCRDAASCLRDERMATVTETHE
jgi:hypothetical protein